MSNTDKAELLVESDLLELTDSYGGELMYQRKDDIGLIAVQLDEDGDEVGRYEVHIELRPIE
jgi:hypothetical protein